uniref:Uncharacterized protein n=1 Tax=Alexandrium monilatum TaxID=311494 RepID=A0A7S4Q0T2_9DINO
MWSPTGLYIEPARRDMLLTVRAWIPRGLLRRMGCARGAGVALPHLYPSIKSKCVCQGGGGRLCAKPGHSCWHKLCSHVTFPGQGQLALGCARVGASATMPPWRCGDLGPQERPA